MYVKLGRHEREQEIVLEELKHLDDYYPKKIIAPDMKKLLR